MYIYSFLVEANRYRDLKKTTFNPLIIDGKTEKEFLPLPSTFGWRLFRELRPAVRTKNHLSHDYKFQQTTKISANNWQEKED